MQVNVKELTGVLHLKLVFMNVLVLQSFLAVSFPSFQVDPVFQVFTKFPSVSPLVWLNHFKCLDCIPSQLQGCKLLVPTMAEAEIVCSLDLMDSYYTLSVSSLY